MKRLIENIRNIETGEEYKAKKLLSQTEEKVFKLRRVLAEYRNKDKKLLVCSICNQPLTIAGNKDGIFFFKHLQDSENCPIKTSGKLNQEEINKIKYQGAKESQKHKDIKNHIYHFLSTDDNFSKVKKEKVIKSIKGKPLTWRKPDVSSEYKGKRIVFEIQLSTTFLNVIVDREIFYKSEEVYIIWFFNITSPSKYRFMEKDILYSNKNNAFIINDETIDISKKNKKLTFICHYKKAYIYEKKIEKKWVKEYITINDLSFDDSEFKIYYYDYEYEKKKLKNHLKYNFILYFEEYWINRDSYKDRYERDLYFISKFEIENIIINDFSKISRILNSLYSLKLNKIIGFKFKNYLSLSNNVLEHSREFTRIYLWAIYIYGHKETIEKQDKKMSFRKKVERYKEERPKQDEKYSKLIYKLFPEIEEVIKQTQSNIA